MIKLDRKFRSIAISGATVLFLLILSLWGWTLYVNLPTGKADSYTITISPGMTAGDIARLLDNEGVIRSSLYFKFVSKTHGYSKTFKAGMHTVDGTINVHEIADLLKQNPPGLPDIRVTVFEGLNINETASILATVAHIDSSDFVEEATKKNTDAQLGVDNDTFEGYLYPDTYFVNHDTKPIEMITRMVDNFHSVFNDSLKRRASEIGMTMNEVVTLASIIETESQLDDERPVVSSVFHNRLKLGRPLEANPTIQYALGSKRRVLLEDLDIDSPYNTYTHAGLPPGPIASPGEKSIIAALYPAETNYLYFMSNGKGGHVFSKSLTEHNRAVLQYKRQRSKSSSN